MIQSGTISTSGTDLLVVPTGKQYTTLLIAVCNNGTGAQLFDLYAVKSGDSPSNSNRIIVNRQLDGYDSFFMVEKLMLEAGDKIRATAQNNGVLTSTVSWASL